MLATVLSLLLANSPVSEQYLQIWHVDVGGLSVEHWINEGVMAIFFLLIGLELEPELYSGELFLGRPFSAGFGLFIAEVVRRL